MNNNIVVIFGGNSLEHSVSLKTGYAIGKALQLGSGSLFFIGILPNGLFKYDTNIDTIILHPTDINRIHINEACATIFQIGNGMINNVVIHKALLATHGKIGEDGNLQGFLTVNNIPFTGNDVNGSVICMNKNICKYIAEYLKIPTVPFVCLTKGQTQSDITTALSTLPTDHYVVKINTGGSSHGVYLADKSNIDEKITQAFELDDVILVEMYKPSIRELSLGIILKNNDYYISDIGEYIKDSNFFSFEKKYMENSCNIIHKKNTFPHMVERALTLFKKLNLTSYGRFDFFLDAQNNLFFNEINSLPGLTETSLFSQMWKDSFSYFELLNFILNC